MDGRLLPEESWTLVPLWLNAFDNTALVQFIHRALALTTAAVVLALSWRAVDADLPAGSKKIAAALAVLVAVQVGLGVYKLLLVGPPSLAAPPQGGAHSG